MTRRELIARRLRDELQLTYPSLTVNYGAGGLHVVGPFPVVDDGVELARFQLKIECDKTFPRWPPLFRETDGRIPIDINRHVVPHNRTFCLFSPAYYWLHRFHRRPLSDLLDGPVRSYLLYQLCVEAKRPWPHGELRHDVEGEFAFFDELFRTTRTVTRQMLLALCRGLKEQSRCPCGSRRAVRRCHRVCLELQDGGAGKYVRSLARRR